MKFQKGYMTSAMVHYFSVRDRFFVYDIDSTQCIELDRMALSILPEVIAGNSHKLHLKYAPTYSTQQIQICVRECKKLLQEERIGAKPSAYRHQIQRNILAVTLHVSHDCNLRCSYCYAGTGSFGRDRVLMDVDTMRKAIDFAFAHSGNAKNFEIGFFGGEPLMNFPLVRDAVAYAKDKGLKLKKNVSFGMTTNATLMTKPMLRFLGDEKFSFIFSIDGPKKIHDSMRKDRSGKGTHTLALKNILEFSSRYPERFTARGTFTRATPDLCSQVVFLNDIGLRNVAIEPARLSPEHPLSLTTESEVLRVNAEYESLAALYVERFKAGKPLHFNHFDHNLRKLLDPMPTHQECGAGANFIAVAPDGRVFPCFECVVEEENCIGHIDHGFDAAKRRILQQIHVDKKRKCSKCWLKYVCGGGCHALNIRFNGNITIPDEANCNFMEHRFKLCAWILAEIREQGLDSVKRLRQHLIGSNTANA